MDVATLAKNACLSVAQVRELLQGEGSLFYSDGIRRQAYKRVLLILGAPPPVAPPPPVLSPTEETPTPQVKQETGIIEQILALNARALHVSMRPRRRDFMRFFWFVLSFSVLGLAGWYWKSAMDSVTAPQPTRSLPVHSEIEAPAAAPPIVTASVPTLTIAEEAPVSKCSYVSGPLPQVTPDNAYKAGRYVYLVGVTPTNICLVDGHQQASMVHLNAGESKSVYGTPPWQLSSQDLQQLQVFFQGSRVTIPADATQRVALIEKPTLP